MIIQKKNWNQITFDFHDDYFLYSMKDSDQERARKIWYLSIESSTVDTITEKNDWFRNVWILWLIIAGYIFFVSKDIDIWFYLWLGMLIFYKIRTTHFSLLRSWEWNILIIKDKNHDFVLASILDARKKLLREKYYSINRDNLPENELNKFEFLRDERVITDDEFKEISEKLLILNGVSK